MNIYELRDSQINPAIAYALGLIYPLYKEKTLNEKEYILGSVNHNPGKITEDEKIKHYKEVYNLFNKCMGDKAPELKANKTDDYTISSKVGFSVLVEKTGVSKEECISILTEKVKEIRMATNDIKKEFIKGCFDGRASWDTTMHYLAIDVDRNYEHQDLIIDIVKSFDISLNINRRDKNHPKNDQLRIKPDSLKEFMTKVGLYSACRKNIVDKQIALL